MVPDFHIYHIWETVWVFLQNPYPVTPVMVVKMVPKAVIGPQGPRASSKVSWALRRAFRETDVKYLRNVFRLTDRQLVPFNFRLHPTHTPSVHFHQSHSKFHSTVRAGVRLLNHSHYIAPLPVQHRPTASSDIPDRSVPS